MTKTSFTIETLNPGRLVEINFRQVVTLVKYTGNAILKTHACIAKILKIQGLEENSKVKF